jgi:Peptidase family M28
MIQRPITYLLIGAVTLTLAGCGLLGKKNTETADTPKQPDSLAHAPVFNADSAYSYVKTQVDFGPRVLNTPAHDRCAAWIVAQMKQWADTVYVQRYTAIGFDNKQLRSTNIVAAFNPAAKTRVFISGHWDTRQWADQREDTHDKPIDGANDAGSGVGVMMEMARVMSQQRPDIGVDLICFDTEDYGQPEFSTLPHVDNTFCLGSQYWGKQPHVAGYRADFGINLDMVGSADAVFYREQISVEHADWVSQYVWDLAGRMGYGSIFINTVLGRITDDHYYVNDLAHIPTIDVIHFSPAGFGSYWHTLDDNIKVISPATLRIVGSVMLQTVYQYASVKKKPVS